MRSGVFWLLVLLGSGLSLGLMWFTDIPLGVPSEWTWDRHDVTPDLTANLLLGLLVGAAYLTFVAWGFRRLTRPNVSTVESLAWHIGLAVMAGVWIWTVQGTGASGPTVGRWPFVLYYPSTSGYFYKARYESPDARRFLANYEALMSEGDVLHIGTHPPGLFLFFHGMIGLAEAAPSVVPAVNATQPHVVREAFDILRVNSENAQRAGTASAPPLNDLDRAVIWVTGLIVCGLSAATVWPLYGFLRHFVDRPSSWLCAAAWPLIPAVSVFMPKSDVAYAFFAMLLAALWISAWRKSSPWLAALTGVIWSISVLCSLAFLPVALWLAVLSLFDSGPAVRSGHSAQELQRAAWTIVPAGLTALAVLAALSIGGEIPLWKTFWLNYRNHAGFYAQYPRTYLSWLAVNPLELACGVGAPVFVVACAGLFLCLRNRPAPSVPSLTAPCLATLAVWGWLWISGKNSGEAARLWIFLMPYAVVCCAAGWPAAAPPTETPRWPRQALAWLGCQAVVCLLTVQRVNGFSLAG